MLEFVVKTHYDFLGVGEEFRAFDAPDVYAGGANWTVEMTNRFRQGFRSDIHTVWNDKLYLCYERAPRGVELHDIKCGVTIAAPGSNPQLRICAMIPPRGEDYIDECVIGGARTGRGGSGNLVRNQDPDTDRPGYETIIQGTDQHWDMFITARPNGSQFRRVFTHRNRPTRRRTRQRTVGHEFGHYLGLSHQCERQAALGHGDAGAGSYCEQPSRRSGRPRLAYAPVDSIMATGDKVYREHAWPWLHRLADHEYPVATRGAITWVPVLTDDLDAFREERRARSRHTSAGTPVSPGATASSSR